MGKIDSIPYEENAFAEFFFQDKEDYENYTKSMKIIMESGEKQDREDLVGEMLDYLDSAKEQLATGNKILAAFYYGHANAIADFLRDFYDAPPQIIESTVGNDFMFLDHELFSGEECYLP